MSFVCVFGLCAHAPCQIPPPPPHVIHHSNVEVNKGYAETAASCLTEQVAQLKCSLPLHYSLFINTSYSKTFTRSPQCKSLERLRCPFLSIFQHSGAKGMSKELYSFFLGGGWVEPHEPAVWSNSTMREKIAHTNTHISHFDLCDFVFIMFPFFVSLFVLSPTIGTTHGRTRWKSVAHPSSFVSCFFL